VRRRRSAASNRCICVQRSLPTCVLFVNAVCHGQANNWAAYDDWRRARDQWDYFYSRMSPHCLARIVRCKMPLRDSAPLHPASDSLRSTCVHPIQPPRWMRRLCRGGSRHLRSRHRAEGLSPRLLWLHSRTPAITGDADSISYRRQPVNGCSSRVVRRSGARGSALWGGCSGGASRGQSVAGGGFPAVLYGHARPQGLGIRRAGASLLFRRVKLVGVGPSVCCLARGRVAHSS